MSAITRERSTIFPLIKRLADLNLNSTFEKNNLMICLEGAIFISNWFHSWFKLGGFKAQEYLSTAIFHHLTNLLRVLASSSLEPEQIPNAEWVKKIEEIITKLCIRSRLLTGPNIILNEYVSCKHYCSKHKLLFNNKLDIKSSKYSFQKGPEFVTVRHNQRWNPNRPLCPVAFERSKEIGRARGSPG